MQLPIEMRPRRDWLRIVAAVVLATIIGLAIIHVETLPPMPIAVGYRTSLLGHGLVITFRNDSDHPMDFVATIEHPDTGTVWKRDLYAAAGRTVETGWEQGWTGEHGDRVEVENNKFRTWRGSIP